MIFLPVELASSENFMASIQPTEALGTKWVQTKPFAWADSTGWRQMVNAFSAETFRIKKQAFLWT